MNVTPSQREFDAAHRARLDVFWPERRFKPVKKRSPIIQPRAPSMREQFAIAWEMLDGPLCRRTVREIQDLVCEHFNVPFLYMETTRRANEYYLPRATAIYLAKKFTNQSHPAIGRRFGNRDHTTILSCVSSVEKMIALNHPIAADIEILSSKLRGIT